MSLPTTVTTVGELLAVLSKLPPEMRVVMADDSLRDYNVEVMYDDTWEDSKWMDHEENVIRLNLGVAL